MDVAEKLEIDALVEKLSAQKVMERKPPKSIVPERMRQKSALSHWLQLKYRGKSA